MNDSYTVMTGILQCCHKVMFSIPNYGTYQEIIWDNTSEYDKKGTLALIKNASVINEIIDEST